MVVSQWMLILGVPTIVALTVMAVRRMRAIAVRIAEIREEEARNPQSNPYQALSEIIEERNKPARSRVRKKS